MPPVPAVDQVARITFQQTLGEDTNINNRVFFSFTGAMTAPIAIAVAGQAASAWNTHMAPPLSSSLVLIGVECLDLTADSPGDGSVIVAHAGADDNAALPAQVTFTYAGLVSRRYRGGKPRFYQSGLTVDRTLDEQQWSDATVVTFGAAFAAMLAEIVGYTSGAVTITAGVNVSYYSGFTSVENPITHRWRNIPTLRITPVVDVINAWNADQRMGSQRRRRI